MKLLYYNRTFIGALSKNFIWFHISHMLFAKFVLGCLFKNAIVALKCTHGVYYLKIIVQYCKDITRTKMQERSSQMLLTT